MEQIALNRGELIALLMQCRGDGTLLTSVWLARRWKLAKAIARQAWDIEAVEKLFTVLEQPVVLEEREEVVAGSHVAERLDRLLASELSLATGLLDSPRMVTDLCGAWLLLEIWLQPDDRGQMQILRERLTVQAEQCEIDLRGLGV